MSSGWRSTLNVHNTALAVALLALALAVTVLRPPPTSGPFARDFEAYEAAGATWAHGGDPYGRDVWTYERAVGGVVATRDEVLPYVGPAAALPLYAALARAPHAIAVRLWGGLLAAAASLLVVASWRLARPPARYRELLAAMIFAVAAGPMISALALGQVALVSAAALALAVLAYERGAFFAGGIATLIAAIQPNLVLALAGRVRSRAVFLTCAGAALVFAVLTLAASGGPAGVARYASILGAHADAERFVTIQHTVTAIAFGFGADRAAARVAGALASLTAIVALVRTVPRLAPLDGALFAIALLPLVLSFSFWHEHDFIVAFVPLFVLAVRATGPARVLAGIAAIAISVDWLGLAQRPPAFAQILAFSIAGGCAFLALGPRDAWRASLAAPLAALALGALAGPLASAHPAPTWPDQLPATWHAGPHASAAEVWHDEQRIAGLERPEPAWALLRAIPLAGTCVLAAAIVLAGRRDGETARY